MSIYFSNIIDPDGGPHADLIEVTCSDPTLITFHEVRHTLKERSQRENNQSQHRGINEARQAPASAGSPILGQKEERNGE